MSAADEGNSLIPPHFFKTVITYVTINNGEITIGKNVKSKNNLVIYSFD